MLGAHRSLKVVCRRGFKNFLKCCMSGPSLHRESTDSLIVEMSNDNMVIGRLLPLMLVIVPHLWKVNYNHSIMI